MSNESYPRSIQATNPVDPSVVRVLRVLDPIAREVDCAYFVAGATARDLILVNLHGLRPGRATVDIDFGIAVESWEQFAILKARLVGTGEFVAALRALQRMIYTDRTTGSSIPVDLIPFGGVASAGTIAWPPNRDVIMNVAGFEEVLESSVSIEIEKGLTVRVASAPGLTLLKLTAWADRGRETNKDAADIYRLLSTYADAGNTDRLYDREMDLLEALGFDMELAGAELLGRDVADIASSPVMAQIRSLLTSELNRERLLHQMAQTTYAEAASFVERIFSGFCRGLLRAK
jgi:predicted nucleotidyltransferase